MPRTKLSMAVFAAGGHLFYLSVVQACKGQLRKDCTDKGKKHIPLRIPDIPLRAEEGICAFTAEQSGPPLYEFIAGADCETDRCHKEEEPLPRLERGPAEENLADKDGRDEPLGDVPQSIVMIAVEIKDVLHPKTQGHARIG